MAWDNSNTHEDDEIEEVLRGAAGRLVPLYLPTYSPWLNPIEIPALTPEQLAALEEFYRTTRDARLRTRARR